MFEPSCSLARRRIENSNFVLLKISVETHIFQRGEQEVFKDPSGLPNLLEPSGGMSNVPASGIGTADCWMFNTALSATCITTRQTICLADDRESPRYRRSTLTSGSPSTAGIAASNNDLGEARLSFRDLFAIFEKRNCRSQFERRTT